MNTTAERGVLAVVGESRVGELAELAGRNLLAALFPISGLGKIAQYGATAGYVYSTGVPGTLLPFVIFLKNLSIIGGFLLLVANGAGSLGIDLRSPS
jgi:uncharacterized membrane protein YphA (DoxX/SURF4 family)